MGKPLFSCYYVSFAWGSKAYGNVLDDQGRIWFYDLGRTWSPQPAGDGLYLETGLRERFRNPVLQSRRVPPAQLADMRKKAEIARGGRIEEKHVSRDAGSGGCEAYLWERSDAYREVKLASRGGYEIRNSSLEAGHLLEWLGENSAWAPIRSPGGSNGSESVHEAAQLTAAHRRAIPWRLRRPSVARG